SASRSARRVGNAGSAFSICSVNDQAPSEGWTTGCGCACPSPMADSISRKRNGYPAAIQAPGERLPQVLHRTCEPRHARWREEQDATARRRPGTGPSRRVGHGARSRAPDPGSPARHLVALHEVADLAHQLLEDVLEEHDA